MTDLVLLDNDIALKISCYDLVEEMLAVVTPGGRFPAMLGVGKYVMRAKAERSSKINDVALAAASIDRLIGAVALIEPNEAELQLAADLEADAVRLGLELDSGESQLLAILTCRGYRLLVTGDKRAIKAMATIAPQIANGRVLCLEQLVARILATVEFDSVRARVCREPRVDQAVTICFGCGQSSIQVEEALQAIGSYVRDLSRGAPGILIGDGHSSGVA